MTEKIRKSQWTVFEKKTYHFIKKLAPLSDLLTLAQAFSQPKDFYIGYISSLDDMECSSRRPTTGKIYKHIHPSDSASAQDGKSIRIPQTISGDSAHITSVYIHTNI